MQLPFGSDNFGKCNLTIRDFCSSRGPADALVSSRPPSGSSRSPGVWLAFWDSPEEPAVESDESIFDGKPVGWPGPKEVVAAAVVVVRGVG